MSWAWRLITGHEPPFEECCITHDLAYWAGGSEFDRRAADRALRDCVRAMGHPIWAWVMYAAVRAFGWWRAWQYRA